MFVIVINYLHFLLVITFQTIINCVLLKIKKGQGTILFFVVYGYLIINILTIIRKFDFDVIKFYFQGGEPDNPTMYNHTNNANSSYGNYYQNQTYGNGHSPQNYVPNQAPQGYTPQNYTGAQPQGSYPAQTPQGYPPNPQQSPQNYQGNMTLTPQTYQVSNRSETEEMRSRRM